MSEITRLVTAEELEKFPDDDCRYELAEGRVIRMSPVGFEHGLIVSRVMAFLSGALGVSRPGVAVPEVGFVLATGPDTVRAPDIAFIRRERMPPRDTRGFVRGAPDLAIEVLSPDDRPGEVREKVHDYLSHDVPCVLVIDPHDQTVTMYRPSKPAQVFRVGDSVDVSDILSGFSLAVAAIFE